MQRRMINFLLLLAIISIGTSCATAGGPNTARGVASEGYPPNPRFEQKVPNEDQLVTEIRDGILALQEKEKQKHGAYLRGTHAKGTCMGGEMEIKQVEAPLNVGLFSVPGRYPVDVRFANADGTIGHDAAPDVRAVSFSIYNLPADRTNPQARMDFAMNNATTFPINDAQVFADVLKVALNPLPHTGDKVPNLAKVGKQIGASREGKALWAIGEGKLDQSNVGFTPFQKQTYWSTVPFSLGDDQAVKYRLYPCDGNKAKIVRNMLSKDELKNELIRHVTKDKVMSCWWFQVQKLDAQKMIHFVGPLENDAKTESETWWVENAATEWPDDAEHGSPFVTVGKLTLTQGSVIPDASCNTRWIDVQRNSSQLQHGLGSINRVRTVAEHASAGKRLGN